MGKILVIKGADFSQVAVNKIPLISEFDTYLTHMWNLTSDIKDSKGNSTFYDGEITEMVLRLHHQMFKPLQQYHYSFIVRKHN